MRTLLNMYYPTLQIVEATDTPPTPSPIDIDYIALLEQAFTIAFSKQ